MLMKNLIIKDMHHLHLPICVQFVYSHLPLGRFNTSLMMYPKISEYPNKLHLTDRVKNNMTEISHNLNILSVQ